jgi:hypothetical protein
MAAAKPGLPEEVKVFIVNALAAFDTPSQVAAAVKEEFEIEVSRQVVQAHDPTKFAGRSLAAKWRTMFEVSRKTFLEDVTAIPIANRATRIRALNRMATRAETMKNFKLAADLHKQAAEEMGNAYTNRREVTGKDGAPLPTAAPAIAIFALPDNGRG